MRTKALGITVGAVMLSAAASAQQRPDLSGTWEATADAPAGIAAAPSAVFGQRFSIRHTGDTLTIVRPQRESVASVTLSLDGREARMRVPGALCQGDAESTEKATWEGEAIAHTIVGFAPSGDSAVSPRSVKRLFRLLTPDSLLVEGTAMQAGQLRQVATVYKRSAASMPALANSPPSGPTATIAQVGWMVGVWSGTTGPTTIEERWTPAASGSMLSIGRTLRNNVMSAFEFLCIVERGGTLVYTAMPNGRTPPTDFTLTSITADAATFENPAHDFPKVIRYAKRADGALEATISGAGGERAQTFVLKKQE